MYKAVKKAGVLMLVSAAFAQYGWAVTMDEMRGQTAYEQAFKSLDSNHDDKLSAAEAAKDGVFGKGGFAKADSNHNGSLSQQEFSSYKSTVDTAENKQAAEDSAITAKIKSKYLIEKNFSSFKVSVETKDNHVILSGFVDTADQKARAEHIARGVSGVKSVKNALEVKP